MASGSSSALTEAAIGRFGKFERRGGQAVQVTKGGGGMPAYGGKLSLAEIRDLAAFVASQAGR